MEEFVTFSAESGVRKTSGSQLTVEADTENNLARVAKVLSQGIYLRLVERDAAIGDAESASPFRLFEGYSSKGTVELPLVAVRKFIQTYGSHDLRQIVDKGKPMQRITLKGVKEEDSTFSPEQIRRLKIYLSSKDLITYAPESAVASI